MYVMVHIDSDVGPIGAWAYRDSSLSHFYPESLDLAISGRARQLMAERTDVSVPDWFLYLTTLTGRLDTFALVQVGDEVDLIDVISEYRRVWNAAV